MITAIDTLATVSATAGSRAVDPHGYRVPRALIETYNTRGPRYTSYPTAPEWRTALSDEDARAALQANREARADVPLSLYVHIPFCVKLCYYCGCNRIITRSVDLVERYIRALDQEVGEVAVLAGERPVVQVHWGGGTPTHLTPLELRRVFGSLAKRFEMRPDAEISIEVHPPVTTFEQLETLRDLGFNRVSMGVQDFDPVVQKAVNRLQSYEQTAALIDRARKLGFQSVNLDLMYGLPFQTPTGFEATLAQVETLRPDRVALFNYAHVPHLQPGQRMIDPDSLPQPAVKLELFEMAIDHFIGRGYRYIGMDHFARPEDELARSLDQRTLRRNFMGYTTCADSDLIGFGISSISDLDTMYLQNVKQLEPYFAAMGEGRIPVARGLALSADDRLRRDIINRLICHCHVEKAEIEALHGIDFDQTFAIELRELRALEADGLVTLTAGALHVPPRGQILLRNVCMPFDAWLRRQPGEARTWSRTV
jgi:oxygen-independent coproporphyrinogen-3 oxidase